MNPLKMKAKAELAKQAETETDIIRGGGERVSITENNTVNQVKGDHDQIADSFSMQAMPKSSQVKPNTINPDSRQSSIGSNSRARIAERIRTRLPPAGTIQIGHQILSEDEIKKKIHVVKHHPKSDEEMLDELITKLTERSIPFRKAQKDAKSELELIKQVL